LQKLASLAESVYALSPMLTGFHIARFGIRNVWPVVSGTAAVAALIMMCLYFYERTRLNKTAKTILYIILTLPVYYCYFFNGMLIAQEFCNHITFDF